VFEISGIGNTMRTSPIFIPKTVLCNFVLHLKATTKNPASVHYRILCSADCLIGGCGFALQWVDSLQLGKPRSRK
jgi:hypothetical protein